MREGGIYRERSNQCKYAYIKYVRAQRPSAGKRSQNRDIRQLNIKSIKYEMMRKWAAGIKIKKQVTYFASD